MTKIQVRQESFIVDYQNQRLPELFRQQASDCDFSSSLVLDGVDSEALVGIINKARQTLLIACEQVKDAALIEALKKKADSGVRIYLLLGDKKHNSAAIDTLSGRCLVRTGVSQQGALVLVDHATIASQGLLLMGPQALTTSVEEAWAIGLEPQQIDDSFRSFCKPFWEDADNEYLQQNQSQQKVSHPDGNVVTNHSHQLCGSLKDCLQEPLNNLVAASRQVFEAEGHAYRLLLASDAQSISQLAGPGVALTDKHVPSLLMSTEGNWLLPDTPDFNSVNWCLKLSDVQSTQLAAAYDVAMENAAWQYKPEVSMGELSTEQALRFSDQPDLVRVVEQGRSHTLDAINTETIDSFLNDSAEALAGSTTAWQRDFMAHQIDYHIAIHPPYCPSSANKDALYEQWQQAEQGWQSQLASLVQKQKTIDDKQASISQRLSGFMKSFLLGQGQSVKQLNRELEALKGWAVTLATPADREEKAQCLEDLKARIHQRGNDTVEKVDEAEQNQRWQEKRESLEKTIAEKTAVVDAKVSSFQSLFNKKEENQQQAESDFLAAWKKAAEGLTDKQLEMAKHSLETLAIMNVEQAEEWKDSFSAKVLRKHYSTLGKSLDNRSLAMQKIERDISAAEKAVQGSRAELERAHSNLDTHGQKFIYQPKKDAKALDQQLGLKNKADQSGPFTWPDEELPAAGTKLRSHKKQRYLVVFDTAQLKQAGADAERLKANVVCDKESVNA